VIRYAILYFTLFFLFIVLIVAPMVAGKFLKLDIDTLPMQLMQPTNLKNNDTTSQTTGTILGAAETGAATSGGAAPSGAESSQAARRFAHFMY
jgi:1,3-beta-glucan synthase